MPNERQRWGPPPALQSRRLAFFGASPKQRRGRSLMPLTQFQSDDRDFQLMQSSWAALLNPLLANPLTKGVILTAVALQTGDNVINHRLGRVPQGWLVIRQYSAYAGLFDKQASNQMPQSTLVLNASGATTVDLYIF